MWCCITIIILFYHFIILDFIMNFLIAIIFDYILFLMFINDLIICMLNLRILVWITTSIVSVRMIFFLACLYELCNCFFMKTYQLDWF